MVGPPELHALVDILPSRFALVDPRESSSGGPRGRCIEGTRLATAVLRHLGVDAAALACDVVAANRAGVALLAEGVPATEWPPHAWSIGVLCDIPRSGANRQEPGRRRGFAGHVVACGDGWFCDLTAQQFHRPERGLVVDAALAGPYDPAVARVSHDLPRGAVLVWKWRPEVRSYRTTPAWRQDVGHGLVLAMAERIKRLTS